MNNFETILVIIFVVGAVLGALIFGGIIKVGSKDKTESIGNVLIWGTFDKGDLTKIIEQVSEGTGATVTYVQKSKATYQQDLIEAFAKDKAPDLFIITTDMVIKNQSFMYKIPYENFSEKSFREKYIDGADIYLDEKGILAFPLVVDPMVMYYNKNMFSNEGFATTPYYWDELFNINDRLTKKEDDGTIKESMIALGQYSNVTNAKDILATLLIQSGNTIIAKTSDETKKYRSVITENSGKSPLSPIETVVNFFIEFSDPSTTAYSWNKSMQNSFDLFTSDKLAIYLGHASELFKIEAANPNISFDVKQILQARDVKSKKTYADMYAIAVNKKSPNISGSFKIASGLSYGDYASSFSAAVSLPPTTRALLSQKPKEPYLETFFNSAIISNSWIDPSDSGSDLIFSELIENVLSNKAGGEDAFGKANNQLNKLIK